jgi:hypothetical protein
VASATSSQFDHTSFPPINQQSSNMSSPPIDPTLGLADVNFLKTPTQKQSNFKPEASETANKEKKNQKRRKRKKRR